MVENNSIPALDEPQSEMIIMTKKSISKSIERIRNGFLFFIVRYWSIIVISLAFFALTTFLNVDKTVENGDYHSMMTTVIPQSSKATIIPQLSKTTIIPQSSKSTAIPQSSKSTISKAKSIQQPSKEKSIRKPFKANISKSDNK